jgi:hypothetical protein
LIWGVKGLIMTRSNLVVTWKDSLKWALFLDYHSGCVVSAGLVVFWVLLQLNFQVVPIYIYIYIYILVASLKP